MGNMQAVVILGAIVAGAVVAVSLFALYPDLMLENTSLDPNSSGGQFSEQGAGDATMAPSGSPQAVAP